jgi:hypothetical protein
MGLIEFYLCHPRDGTADTAPWYYGAVERTIGYHVLVNSKKGPAFRHTIRPRRIQLLRTFQQESGPYGATERLKTH